MGLIRIRDTLRKWMELQTVYRDGVPRQMTYDDLAEQSNINISLFRKVMSGHANVTTRVQMKLCSLTRFGLGDLFEYDPDGKADEDEKDE